MKNHRDYVNYRISLSKEAIKEILVMDAFILNSIIFKNPPSEIGTYFSNRFKNKTHLNQ